MQRTVKLDLLAFEDRTVPATITFSSGVVRVAGDIRDDEVTITRVAPPNAAPYLSVSAIGIVPSSGTRSPTNFRVLESAVGSISVDTFGGNDRVKLLGSSKPMRVDGGAGNDTIRGGSGNDTLYGGAGNDFIFGGAGKDGVTGGTGRDYLQGDAGTDRFLFGVGEGDKLADFTNVDAQIRFTGTWTNAEIQMVDAGLGILQSRTNNTNLLKSVNSTMKQGTITFNRGAASPTNGGSVTLAVNFNNGIIEFYDGAFTDPNIAALTAIHEVGHNWDDEHGTWKQWRSLSGWISNTPQVSQNPARTLSIDQRWYYTGTSSFSRDYGRTNPFEDWSTSWESYFLPYFGGNNPFGDAPLSAAKQAHLTTFFNLVSNLP